jgi:RNA polymerase sigma factor (sigma-70 family)
MGCCLVNEAFAGDGCNGGNSLRSPDPKPEFACLAFFPLHITKMRIPMMTDDSQLLVTCAHDRSAGGFAALVARHIDFVYAAALRQTGDPHIAQDITQAVFLLFSQRAGRLKRGTLVKGWLFNATRYVVANARRAEARRKLYEREAAAMRSEIVTEDHWPSIAPHLDDALAGLSEKDRRVLLLRFFEDLTLSALGQTLGISEYAAQKRVARALERLRHSLVGRGATVAGASLGGVLQTGIAQAAPAHLAKATIDLALHRASVAAHSSSAFSLSKGAAKMMSRARAKLLAIQCVIAAATIGTAVVLAAPQFRSTPSGIPVVMPTADAANTSKVIDEDYNTCCQALKAIIDAYDHNDAVAAQALYYFKPGMEPKTIDAVDRILELDVAAYRLSNAAISKFGMHGTLLITDMYTPPVMFLEILSRISPKDARVVDDNTLTLTPRETAGPNTWPPDKPIYFERMEGAWKLDAGRSFRIVFRAIRHRPIAGERSEQTFAAATRQLAGQFDLIADDIDKGKVADVTVAQRRIDVAWHELNLQFRDFGCDTMHPR